MYIFSTCDTKDLPGVPESFCRSFQVMNRRAFYPTPSVWDQFPYSDCLSHVGQTEPLHVGSCLTCYWVRWVWLIQQRWGGGQVTLPAAPPLTVSAARVRLKTTLTEAEGEFYLFSHLIEPSAGNTWAAVWLVFVLLSLSAGLLTRKGKFLLLNTPELWKYSVWMLACRSLFKCFKVFKRV